MGIFESVGNFLGGGEQSEPEKQEKKISPEDQLKDLEDRKRQIIAFNREGEWAPADRAEIANINRQIIKLKGNPKEETV